MKHASERRGVRLVVGISGSSGAVYGVRLLEVLAERDDIETHVVITKGARATIAYETARDPHEVAGLADRVYDDANVGAALASGTFPTDGMVVVPCSMRTLASITVGLADSLLIRAADVTLKERRPLVVVPRETPLHLGHLRHMVALTEIGGTVLPPVPGFYIRPTSIGELVDHTITKILDQFGIDADLIERWTGIDGSD